jgi:cell division protein FtsW
MAVVMGVVPNKGLVLPFLSYGGSSLLCTLFSMGVLLNISSHVEKKGLR